MIRRVLPPPPDPRHEAAAADPLELVGVTLRATRSDLVEMARCLVEEYVMLGYPAERVLRFFEVPAYLASHGLLRQLGRDVIVALIAEATEG